MQLQFTSQQLRILFLFTLLAIITIQLRMGAKQNKPKILTMAPVSDDSPLPESMSQALIMLANGDSSFVYIDNSLKGAELKQLVYTKISPLLTPKNMILEFNKKRIADEIILGSILTLKDVIIQKKIPLGEVSRIEFLSGVEDEISLQKGVAKMPCGHLMGRQSIISLLECVASSKKWEIYCPLENCDKEWDYSFCKKVGALTSQEDKYYTAQFTNNWLEHFAKKCPGCGSSIMKEGDCDKVRCSNSSCKFGYFCFRCFKSWKSKNYLECGNEECRFKDGGLMEEKKEMVLVRQEDYSEVTVEVPVMRLCPSCNLPIEHISGCKHMKCYNCSKQFCWVCLAILKRQWPCGSYNQFCGTVAPVQKLH